MFANKQTPNNSSVEITKEIFMVANCMSFVFLKTIDKQSCTLYLEIKILKSTLTANKYVKTKVWQKFYKTHKKVIIRHLNTTEVDEAFSWTMRTKTRGQKYLIRDSFISC